MIKQKQEYNKITQKGKNREKDIKIQGNKG